MTSVEESFPVLHGVLQLQRNPAFAVLHEKDPLGYIINRVCFSVYTNSAAGQYVTLAGVAGASELDVGDVLSVCMRLEAMGYLKISPSEESYILCPTEKLMHRVEAYINDLVRKARPRNPGRR